MTLKGSSARTGHTIRPSRRSPTRTPKVSKLSSTTSHREHRKPQPSTQRRSLTQVSSRNSNPPGLSDSSINGETGQVAQVDYYSQFTLDAHQLNQRIETVPPQGTK